MSNPALHRPSSLYASRRTGLATPPPSRPNSGSSRASFQAVPPHLSFLDPSIPPLPFSPSEHPEGTVVEESNLFIARGKPRLGLTHWQHAAVYRAHQALDEYVPEVRELSRRAREQGRAAVDKLRLEVYMPVRTLVETAVAVLRMLQSGEEGMEVRSAVLRLVRPTPRRLTSLRPQMMAAVASRLVHLRWGDDEEWKGISHLHFDRAIDAIGISQRNTRTVSEFTALAVETFQGAPPPSPLFDSTRRRPDLLTPDACLPPPQTARASQKSPSTCTNASRTSSPRGSSRSTAPSRSTCDSARRAARTARRGRSCSGGPRGSRTA